MAKAGLKNEAARQELIAEMDQLKKDNFQADGTRKKDFVPHDISRIAEIEGELGISAGEPTAETADYQTLKKMAKDLGIKAVGKTEVLRAAVVKARDEDEIMRAAETAPEPEPESTDADVDINFTPLSDTELGPGPAGETDAAKIKRLEKEIKASERKYGRSREAQKMRSVDTVGGKHVKRPDEIMEEALDDAEDREPAEWDDSNRLAVEREIRKYVKKGGVRADHKGDFYDIAAGFKKGITPAQKKYCLELLEKMGRLTCSAAKIVKLLDERATLSPGQQKQTAKEHNAELEKLGVMWDEEIQVPGMSAVLK